MQQEEMLLDFFHGAYYDLDEDEDKHFEVYVYQTKQGFKIVIKLVDSDKEIAVGGKKLRYRSRRKSLGRVERAISISQQPQIRRSNRIAEASLQSAKIKNFFRVVVSIRIKNSV